MKILDQKLVLLRNAVTNWVVLFLNIIVVLLLTPFVISKLGKEIYGVWVLLMSIMTYLTMLDFGMSGALKRFISKYEAVDNHEEIESIISTSFIGFLLAGIACFIFGLAASQLVPSVFSIPELWVTSASYCMIILGIDIGLALAFNVVNGTLWAFQRFDITNYCQIGALFVRVILTVYALNQGHGIVSLALIALLVNILRNLYLTIQIRRIYSRFRITLKYAKMSTFKYIWQFSLFGFLTTLSKLTYDLSGVAIIGYFLSPTHVAYYSVSWNFIQYTINLTGAASGVITPAASRLESLEKHENLSRLLIAGTKLATIISLAAAFGFILFGYQFISLWLGPEFAKPCYSVLVIMAIGSLFASPQAVGYNILMGISRHKQVFLIVWIDTLIYIALAFLLIHKWGINGVATGMLIGRVIVYIFLLPIYTAKTFELQYFEFIKVAFIIPLISSIPYLITGFFSNSLIIPDSYLKLTINCAISLIIFFAAAYKLTLSDLERLWLIAKLQSLKNRYKR